MHSSCLWRDTVSQSFSAPNLSEDISCDVAVVGGGFTGMRAAIDLAKAGTSVAVLEAGELGSGASGLNGGQVNPMLPLASPSDLQSVLDDFWAQRVSNAALNSADYLFEFIRENKIECGARQNGWLRPHHSSRARNEAIRAVETWNKHGADLSLIDEQEISKLSGASSYIGATIVPRGGAVQPLSLLFGMAICAENLGVRIYSGSEVSSVRRDNGKWNLKAANNNVQSDAVIVATNGYTGGLVPGLEQSVLPIYSIQIATEPLDPELAQSILPKGHTFSDTRRVLFYGRKEPDNRLVLGSAGITGTASGLGGFRWLERALRKLFPQIGNVPISHRWGGRVARTGNKLPHLHECAPGLFAGLGYNGRGVALSSMMGVNLAKMIKGESREKLDFPVTPISPYPNRALQKFGSGIAIRMMRMLDGLEVRS